jgi:hypothetical protein
VGDLMESENIKKIAEAAQEAVKNLDPDLKGKAFETILSRMLDANIQNPKAKKSRGRLVASKQGVTKPKNDICETNVFKEQTIRLQNGINRTKYPLMFKLDKALDKALYLLSIAQKDFVVDGLVPSQIASLLTNNFRLKTTANAISMALMDAKTYVDRRPVTIRGGSGYVYFIMHDGETHLTGLLEQLRKEKKADIKE